ncbi:MAG: hypothetical protein JSV55_01805 [Deltaproteobacteria bacterium]|nr:MAG: hypothetical protein JSV55_01805 [Deltaproteobacteria bacterium]
MNKRISVIAELLRGLLFPLVILAIAVYVFVSSFDYKFASAAFAGGFAGILIVLSVSLIIREIVRGVKGPGTSLESSPRDENQRTTPLIVPIAWFAAFVVALLFIGLLLAIPIWVFAFLLWHRASYVFTFVTPAVLWAVMKFGVESGLGMVFFEGILFGGKPPVLW